MDPEFALQRSGIGAGRKPPPWSPWRRRADQRHDLESLPYAKAAIRGIKAAHTLAWFSIECCMLFVLYSGLVGRTDRRVAIAAAVVAGESLVFVGYGFRCPLTEVAERFGADRGGVTDIYLPAWFAHNIPAIHVPLIAVAVALHQRNLRAQGGCGRLLGRPRRSCERAARDLRDHQTR